MADIVPNRSVQTNSRLGEKREVLTCKKCFFQAQRLFLEPIVGQAGNLRGGTVERQIITNKYPLPTGTAGGGGYCGRHRCCMYRGARRRCLVPLVLP